MGTYLRYHIEDVSLTEKANEIFKKHTGSTCLWDEEDRTIELKKLKETGHGCPDLYKIGEGNFKVSGADEYMTKDFPPFARAVSAIRKTVGEIDFMGSNDVTDYLNNKQLQVIFGPKLQEYLDALKKDQEDYQYNKQVWEESRKWNKKSVHETILTVKTWGAKNDRIGLLYGSVDRPAFLKVHPQKVLRGDGPEWIYPLERTKEGHGIMLIPLQALDGYFVQEDKTRLTITDIINDLFRLGVRDNIYRLLYRLYKRTLNVDGLNALTHCEYFDVHELFSEYEYMMATLSNVPQIRMIWRGMFDKQLHKKKWTPQESKYGEIIYLQTLVVLWTLLGQKIVDLKNVRIVKEKMLNR